MSIYDLYSVHQENTSRSETILVLLRILTWPGGTGIDGEVSSRKAQNRCVLSLHKVLEVIIFKLVLRFIRNIYLNEIYICSLCHRENKRLYKI